ncbi:MAG: hypothetical protein QJR08_04405 [Bacillota bacterium]|nr:hypothetical protein [Bacillota bacterium]
MMPYPPERFDRLVEEFTAHSVAIMQAKREEYSPTEDRLQNFHEVAAFLGVRASQVALMYMMKHLQSVSQAVRSGKYEWVWTTTDGREGLKQRIADIINYAYLLAACIDEEADER